jgi:hypothetical protein
MKSSPGRKLEDLVSVTFRAAIEQARDPYLPPEKCRWWYWSRVRKAVQGTRARKP